jgi:hypothetical protein
MATPAMAVLVAPVSSAVLYGLNAPAPFVLGARLIAAGGLVFPARHDPDARTA